jgi:4-hydroxy-tetrahydrodipicolinate synthase
VQILFQKKQRNKENKMTEFKGILMLPVTPFDEGTEAVNYDKFERQLEYMIKKGAHGLVTTGSTGEFASLTEGERKKIAQNAVEIAKKRLPVIIGASATTTRETIMYCQHAEKIGADGVMLVHPYYCLPKERELYEHYKSVAESIKIPIIIYNNPYTSGVDAKPELLSRLSEIKNIQYIKEATGDVTRVTDIIRLSKGRLKVLQGWDNIVFESFASGAVGWIAGTADIIPDLSLQLYQAACVEKNMEKAREIWYRILPIGNLLEREGIFIGAIKAGLNLQGVDVGVPRRPLLPLSEQDQNRLKKLMQEAGALKK